MGGLATAHLQSHNIQNQEEIRMKLSNIFSQEYVLVETTYGIAQHPQSVD